MIHEIQLNIQTLQHKTDANTTGKDLQKKQKTTFITHSNHPESHLL